MRQYYYTRGFQTLRTQPGAHDPHKRIERDGPKCKRCGAYLRAGNESGLCAAHRPGAIRCEDDLPEWAVALVNFSDSVANIGAVVESLTGQARAETRTWPAATKSEARRMYATGLHSYESIGACVGASKNTVRDWCRFVVKPKEVNQ
jgi:hypothetical protein